jgi:drug/metabolite transporter (DMT)-like permease
VDLGDFIDLNLGWETALKAFLIFAGGILVLVGYGNGLSPLPGWAGMLGGGAMIVGSLLWIVLDLVGRKRSR